MRKVMAVLALGGAVAAMSTAGVSAKTMHETIHLTAPKGMSALHMTMATATVTYTAKDVSIKVTVMHLPKASSIHHSKYYVVWVKNGSKNWFLGDLKVTGSTGKASGMLMIKHFQDITISAEKAMHPMHAMGTMVLSGMSSM